MVRFIISVENKEKAEELKIYIPIWLDLLSIGLLQTSIRLYNLHSNMVRFIIITHSLLTFITSPFTFQYG